MPQQSYDEEKQFVIQDKESNKLSLKVATLFFYVLNSLLLTAINRSILITYQFPAFTTIALGQMVTAVIVLHLMKTCGKITYPKLRLGTFIEIFPLSFLNAAHLLLALSATQKLNLPTSVSLRRLGLPMTMVAEYYILGMRPRFGVILSVLLIVIGGIVAAADDLSFNSSGYLHLMFANFVTAFRGVCTKEKLDKNAAMGKFGLIFYSSFFMAPFVLLWVYCSGDLVLALNHPSWRDPFFSILFSLTCIVGSILMFSTMLCTQHNSPLTVNVVSCLKNIFVTYWGIFAGDYIFSWMNFVGINLGVLGSLLYAYVTFQPIGT